MRPVGPENPEHPEVATGEEEVPRFSFRRGTRFSETFLEGSDSVDADDEWLAGLRQDVGADGLMDSGEGGGVDTEPEPRLAGADSGKAEEASKDDEAVSPFEAASEVPLSTAFENPGGQDHETMIEELVASALDQSSPPSDPAPAAWPGPPPGLAEAMSVLAERLAALEEALAKAGAACTVTRIILGQGQAMLDRPSESVERPQKRGRGRPPLNTPL